MAAWTPLIAAHAATAATSLLLGGYQLARRTRGDTVHRRLGWVWIAGMSFVATSSFAIRELRHGQLSLLHALSIVTLLSLGLGIVRIRRGDAAGHRAAMRGSWIGLVAAFIAAVAVPSRRIPTFTMTQPAGAALAATVVITLTAAMIFSSHRFGRYHRSHSRPRGASLREET